MDSFDDVNSSCSSEMFSPISISFFQPKNLQDKPNQAPLLPQHDTSWIGARLSPIRSFESDDDDDDDENRSPRQFVSETTSLLRPKSGTLHPAYIKPTYRQRRGKCSFQSPMWIILSVSALQLGASWVLMMINDVDVDHSAAVQNWRSMLWRPDTPTFLLAVGALGHDTFDEQSFWRNVTSLFLSTNALEWCVVAGVTWKTLLLRRKFKPRAVGSVYLFAAVTGQLWMFAVDTSTLATGCLLWGTAGVLCATGMSCPRERHTYFACTIVLVVVSFVCQPYTSIVGTLGGAYFGWAIGGAGMYIPHKSSPEGEWRCAVIAILLFVVPLMRIAFL